MANCASLKHGLPKKFFKGLIQIIIQAAKRQNTCAQCHNRIFKRLSCTSKGIAILQCLAFRMVIL